MSDLSWTILRPGRLTDEPATGRVSLGPDVERGEVTRADVAAVVAAVIDVPTAVGKQWNLVGGDTPWRTPSVRADTRGNLAAQGAPSVTACT